MRRRLGSRLGDEAGVDRIRHRRRSTARTPARRRCAPAARRRARARRATPDRGRSARRRPGSRPSRTRAVAPPRSPRPGSRCSGRAPRGARPRGASSAARSRRGGTRRLGRRRARRPIPRCTGRRPTPGRFRPGRGPPGPRRRAPARRPAAAGRSRRRTRAAVVWRLVAPGPEPVVAAAGGRLPLRLGRQPHSGPAAEGAGVVQRHVGHRDGVVAGRRTFPTGRGQARAVLAHRHRDAREAEGRHAHDPARRLVVVGRVRAGRVAPHRERPAGHRAPVEPGRHGDGRPRVALTMESRAAPRGRDARRRRTRSAPRRPCACAARSARRCSGCARAAGSSTRRCRSGSGGPASNRLLVGGSRISHRVRRPGLHHHLALEALAVARADDRVVEEHVVPLRIVLVRRVHVDQLGREVGVERATRRSRARPRSAR